MAAWLIAVLAVVCVPGIADSPVATAEEILNPRDFVNKPVPKWENGFFVGFELEPQYAPPVFAYDRSGNKLFEGALRIEGASRVWLRSMAASRDGRFAFAGHAVSAGGTAVPFVAILDRAGRVTRLNRLEGASARHLCFAPDGTLWAAMWRFAARPGEPAPEHDILRAYSPEGEQRLSALPSSEFAAFSGEADSHPHAAAETRFAPSQLVASEKGIAFISPAFKQLIRLDLGGKVVSRTPIARPAPDAYITGFALSPEGDLFVSTQEATQPAGQDFVFYRWDDASGNWSSVYSRPWRDLGRAFAVAMIEGGAMLVTTVEGRYRWIAREGPSYRFADR